MGVLDGFEPQAPFKFFEEITKIPRGSYHEEQIGAYLIQFAKDRSLEWHQDDAGNVIIIKEATPGHESAEPIILQGHMDMVCEQEPWCKKDMAKEGIDLLIDGDWITADGTTLGGDDGAGVAYALALLDSEALVHPRLEFVCTVGEEVGMDGARELDVTPLKGKRLLNMDDEEEGVVLAACAGGSEAHISLDVTREKVEGATGVLLSLEGLSGGHSGTEIDKGPVNATFALARVLREALEACPDMRLVSFAGGTKSNAIPPRAQALVATADPAALIAAAREVGETLAKEYAIAEPTLSLVAEDAPLEVGANPLDETSTFNVLALFAALPNGVIRMSDAIPGMVETSLSWGIAKLEGNTLELVASLRSCVDSANAALADQVKWIAGSFGASCTMTGEYPAWQWVENSPLRDTLVAKYHELFGEEMKVQSLHAGVECGLLAGKIEGLDAVSIGPEMTGVHTTEERLSITSFIRTYQLVEATIEALA